MPSTAYGEGGLPLVAGADRQALRLGLCAHSRVPDAQRVLTRGEITELGAAALSGRKVRRIHDHDVRAHLLVNVAADGYDSGRVELDGDGRLADVQGKLKAPRRRDGVDLVTDVVAVRKLDPRSRLHRKDVRHEVAVFLIHDRDFAADRNGGRGDRVNDGVLDVFSRGVRNLDVNRRGTERKGDRQGGKNSYK